jgi:hypothetical protein
MIFSNLAQILGSAQAPPLCSRTLSNITHWNCPKWPQNHAPRKLINCRYTKAPKNNFLTHNCKGKTVLHTDVFKKFFTQTNLEQDQ